MTYKHFAAAVAVLFMGVSAQAQAVHEWRSDKGAGYKYDYVSGDPMKTRFYTLGNGMKVILSPTKKEPRMHVFIATKAGSKTDPADHTGLAHYLEHMMFKGTEHYGSLDWPKEKIFLEKIDGLYEEYNHTKDEDKRKTIYKKIDSVSGVAAKFAIANEYDKMMTSLGAKGTNAFTSFEQTVYTEDIPANAADKFFKVQAERFKDPVFRIFHTELEAVYEEKNRTLDNDNRKVSEMMLANLFLNHNYGKQTTIGTIEHLKNPSLLEIRKYFNTYYVPNNMGIIVSGDFDPDVLIKTIDKYFSGLKKGKIPPYTFEPEKPITEPIVKEVFGPDAEFVTIGYRLPGVHDKDALLADLVGEMLTNGKAGLIDLNLVKKQKLLKASASADVLIDYGYLYLQGTPTTGQNLEEVKDLVLGEIENLKSGNFDDDLVTSIINNQKKTLMQQTERYSSRASALMNAFTSEEDWKEDVDIIERLSRVSKKDIVAFAKKYFENNYVVVYKRKGEDKNVVKVEKPPITPVETNRDAQSNFVKEVINEPTDPLKPVWLDYSKDFQRSEFGPAEIFYVHNEENGLFKMAYRFKMGNWNDRRLAVAAQYLQFLGTGDKTAEQISKEFYKLACSFSVRADNEYTTINVEGLSENFDKAVKILENLLANCKPDEAALNAMKGRIMKSRNDAKTNKGMVMQSLVMYSRYGGVNPFNYVLSDDELKALTGDEFVNLLHSLPQYSHRIIYYGPLTLGNLKTALKTLHPLGDMFKASPAPKVFEPTVQTQNRVFFSDYDMVQSEIRWVRNVQGYDPAKQPVIDVFNNYFGGGMGALVFQTIRESKALAYSTNAYFITPDKKEDPYMVSAYIGCQADKFKEAVQAMNELLGSLPRVDNGLKAARSSLKKDIEAERIMNDAVIYNYLAAERKGLNEDIRKKVYDAADKVTFEDLKKFHEDNFAGKPYNYCVVASEKKISMDDLNKLGTVTKLSLTELFGY